uniref:Uncharacterized protein n=1 Tax=Anguilla anguilla TaxID=7936 RepID=A0A0E9TLD0_ANGAN
MMVYIILIGTEYVTLQKPDLRAAQKNGRINTHRAISTAQG